MTDLNLFLGIFSDVLKYVIQYCNGPQAEEDEFKKKLIECIGLLRALACKNPDVQER